MLTSKEEINGRRSYAITQCQIEENVYWVRVGGSIQITQRLKEKILGKIEWD